MTAIGRGAAIFGCAGLTLGRNEAAFFRAFLLETSTAQNNCAV
jgi:hypothetical protein